MASRNAIVIVVLGMAGGAAAAIACVSSTSNPSPGSSSGGVSSSGGAEDGGGGGSSGSSSGTTGSSGGSSSGSGGSSSSGGSCTYSVSGAVTANGTCTAVGAYAANNAITAFGFTPGQSSPSFAISVELGKTPAAFQAGTYTAANVLKADGEYAVISGTSAQIWTFFASDGGVDGGFTLNLTSTGPEIVTDGGAAWPSPHGNVSVTLNPSTGATGVVTGTATF